MGKPCFSKVVKFFSLVLLGSAAAIAAIAVLPSPAAAHSHNDDGGGDTISILGILIICVMRAVSIMLRVLTFRIINMAAIARPLARGCG